MKKLFAACAFLLLAAGAGAQKIYFIYIQSESNTPFFVRMGDKITSSTASGYAILPKLVDSTYQLSVGKNGQAASEARFSVTINKQDKGFLLRETDGKASLFDLQTLTLLQPVSASTSANENIMRRTDAFSILLAQAANDPSLLEVRTAVAVTNTASEPKKAEPAVAITSTEKEPVPEPKADTTTTTTTDVATVNTNPPVENTATTTETVNDTVADSLPKETEVAAQPAEESKPYTLSRVTRRSESSTSEGFGLTFLDEAEGSVDTIRILIPNQMLSTRDEAATHEDSKKFLNLSNTDTATTVSVADANEKLRDADRNKRKACADPASEKEFFKLRKNMASEETDDAMIDVARKTFKRVCFSTQQIRNLSSLFLTPAGKYQFFDAAYGHISNQEQYSALESELTDAYYVNRFKALIAQQ